jgi:hypothetical protein
MGHRFRRDQPVRAEMEFSAPYHYRGSYMVAVTPEGDQRR